MWKNITRITHYIACRVHPMNYRQCFYFALCFYRGIILLMLDIHISHSGLFLCFILLLVHNRFMWYIYPYHSVLCPWHWDSHVVILKSLDWSWRANRPVNRLCTWLIITTELSRRAHDMDKTVVKLSFYYHGMLVLVWPHLDSETGPERKRAITQTASKSYQNKCKWLCVVHSLSGAITSGINWDDWVCLEIIFR